MFFAQKWAQERTKHRKKNTERKEWQSIKVEAEKRGWKINCQRCYTHKMVRWLRYVRCSDMESSLHMWDDELHKQQQWQQLSSVRSPSSNTRVSKTYRNCFDVRLRPLVAAADSLKLSEISNAVVCTSNFQPFSKINHWICDDFFPSFSACVRHRSKERFSDEKRDKFLF